MTATVASVGAASWDADGRPRRRGVACAERRVAVSVGGLSRARQAQRRNRLVCNGGVRRILGRETFWSRGLFCGIAMAWTGGAPHSWADAFGSK